MSQSQGQLEEYNSTVITKGLKAALAESSIDHSVSFFEDSHIKLNKLMYAAAAEMGILDQLQHSWHIYGSDLGDLVPPTQTVRPMALDQLPQTEKPPRPSIDGPDEDVIVEDDFDSSTDDLDEVLFDETDFYEFFMQISIGELNSLEEILRADRVELLDEFYDAYSGEIGRFYQLYSYNVDIQKLLEFHQDETNIQVDAIGENEYEQVNRFIRQMRSEFFKHEEFKQENIEELGLDLENDLSEMFIGFLDLIDDIYFYLSRKSESEIEGDASHVIDELKSFYLNQAWKAVTEIISFHTIRGPRQGRLEYGAMDAIRTVDASYCAKLDRLLSECKSANILPSEPEDPDVGLLSADESVELLKSDSLLND